MKIPIPKPTKNEKQNDYISRCMGSNVMQSEFPDQDQRAAVCYDTWRKSKKQKNSQSLSRELFTFDLASDGACRWVSYENGQQLIKFDFSIEKNYYPAVAVIGDRFYHGNKFLPFKEIQKTYTDMNGAFHDMNHWGTSYYSFFGTNIEWIIGYEDETYLDENTKQMVTKIFIEPTAPKAQVFNGFLNICKKANRTPNVSVAFWGDTKFMRASELEEDVDYKSQGIHDDDEIAYLYDLEWLALSTVLEGACDDKAGCGIGIGLQGFKPVSGEMNENISISFYDEEIEKNRLNKINETKNIYTKRRIGKMGGVV